MERRLFIISGRRGMKWDDTLRWLKDTCVLLLDDTSARGSGYLSTADRVATLIGHHSKRKLQGGALLSWSLVLLCMSLVGCGGATQRVRPAMVAQGRCVLVPPKALETVAERGELHSTQRGAQITFVQAVPGSSPVTPLSPPPASALRGLAGEGLGDGVPRGVLRLVPRSATSAEIVVSGAAGEMVVVGSALVAAVGSGLLVCLTAHAAAHGEATPIDVADEYYGTHFGDVLGWVQGQQPSEASRSQPDPETLPLYPPDVLSERSPGKSGDKRTNFGRIYVTYTKRNKMTGLYYSGRTSMVVNLSAVGYLQAALAVLVRDKNHHLDENVEPDDSTFEAAAVDRFAVGTAVDYRQRYSDTGYWGIRGREQQLIDHHGGAHSDTGKPYRTENALRGVAKDNRSGRHFHEAANRIWGELHHYTGHW